MTKPTDPDFNQLEETIAQLTAAIVAQEKRSIARANIIRWGAIALVAAAITISSIAFNTVTNAQAQQSGGSSKKTGACDPMKPETMATQACTFEQTSQFFYTMNQLMVGMAQTEDVRRRIAQHPEWLEAARSRIVDQMSEGNPEWRKKWDGCQKEQQDRQCQELLRMVEGAANQMAFGSLVAQTVVNAGKLVNRIREDSDEIRARTGHVGGPVGAVALELERMNIALASVPAMVAQMDLMNRNMAAMSYSMGSTMGRMGSIMPW